MARQNGALRFTGKWANVVGFGNNSSSKKTGGLFVRERATTISNPKTYAQSRQRAKSRPAQLFYQAFENILNHAFYPLDRASKNRNRFISYAMRLKMVSDVPKGAAYIPFLPYRISEGSLGIDSFVKTETIDANVQDHDSVFHVGNGCVGFPSFNAPGIMFSRPETVADISEQILINNPLLSEGEELTFLGVLAKRGENTSRSALHFSFVINTKDSITTLSDLIPAGLDFYNYGEDQLAIGPADIDNYGLLSAGLIVSSRAGNTWRYTNSYMGMSLFATDSVDWDENAVIASYMAEGTDRESDKILQQADNQESRENVSIQSYTTTAVALAAGQSGTLSDNSCGIVVMSDGSRRVVITNAGEKVIVKRSGNNFIPLEITIGGGQGEPGVIVECSIDKTTLAGNPTVTVSQVIAAGV